MRVYAEGCPGGTDAGTESRGAGGWDMTSHIKLYGGKAERFEEVKSQLSDKLGYEPTNPEVIGILMGEYSLDTPAARATN
jgi:hypothetical protein